MTIQKMDKKWKKKWVEALRSGKYTKARSRLKVYNNTFCSIGVLCDLYDPKGWDNNNIFHYKDSAFNVHKLLEDLNISHEQKRKIIYFNDLKEKSFNWIASYIERYM